MEFLFSWSTWCLTCSLSSLVRYWVEYSNRISTFLCAHILFFISFSNKQQSSWPMGEANNNRLLTKLTWAILGNIGPRSWLKLGLYRRDRGPIFPSMARVSSVSKLFIIWHSVSDSKIHFRWLAPSSSIHLWNFGKISIFLASSGSFNLKNDKFHSFFSLFWLQILNWPALLRNKNTQIGWFPWKQSVPYCEILTKKEPIRAQGFS